MNLKDFYYRQYYKYQAVIDNRERKINLKKSEDKAQRERVEKYNAPIFRLANEKLTNFELEDTTINKIFSWQLEQDSSNPPIQLTTTYPGLLIGSGYSHETGSEGELKLGFFFDHTSGLPILPGSSIKGILRSVFPQFKTFGENKLAFTEPEPESAERNKCTYLADLFRIEDDPKLIHYLELSIFEGVNILKTADGQTRQDTALENKIHYRSSKERDIFLDAFISGSYNTNKRILGTDALTPHGDNPLKNPIPLPFLKILPGVVFTFTFRLSDSPLSETVTITPSQKRQAFQAILLQFGIGAKTNVGYGQFLTPEKYQQLFEVNNGRRQGQNQPRNNPSGQTGRTEGRGSYQQNRGDTSNQAVQTNVNTPRPAATPKAKTLSKWNIGEHGIIGTVLRHEGGKVIFNPENIEGFDGLLVSDNVRPNSLGDFKEGLRFNLKLIGSKKTREGFLPVHVHSFKPLE